MHKFLLLGLMILSVEITVAQKSIVLIDSVLFRGNILAADNMGNAYVAGENRMLKVPAGGGTPLPYQEYRFGKIGMIDVSNPLKILVFFPDFMTVVVLDKFLSPLTTYNFFELGFQNVTAVCSSTDGRFWFYDNLKFTLKKIDETGRVFRESQPINQVLEEPLIPNFIQEKDNHIFVNDSTIGVLVFDIFGGYAKTLPLHGLNRFQIHNEKIYFTKDGFFHSYDLNTMENLTTELPGSGKINDAAITNNRLFILKSNKLEIFNL